MFCLGVCQMAIITRANQVKSLLKYETQGQWKEGKCAVPPMPARHTQKLTPKPNLISYNYYININVIFVNSCFHCSYFTFIVVKINIRKKLVNIIKVIKAISRIKLVTLN